jgi:hypothetical protein
MSIKRRIKNLIRWFPIIWGDADWDYSYTLNILKAKINFQAEYINKKDLYENTKYNVEKMTTCAHLIDDIQNQFYIHEYTDYFIKFDDYFKKYPHAYREVTKTDKYIFNNDTKMHIAMNMGHYMHNKANDILFKLLRQNIERWWC